MKAHASHAAAARPAGGFTMVELIVVMVLIGILGAIGAARFFDRTGFDAAAFAEQGRGMLRYAQKLAVAQNRRVYVQAGGAGLALCFSTAVPCVAGDQVPTPAGSNSGSGATRTQCASDGAYAAAWYCEGVPAGATLTPNPAAQAVFYFSGLGRPYLPADDSDADAPSGFGADLVLDIAAGGSTRTVTVASETGYVF